MAFQLIPVSEVAAKDEFASIKHIRRADLRAALRIPAQPMGIVPQNAGRLGSLREAAEGEVVNGLEPQTRWARSTRGGGKGCQLQGIGAFNREK